MLPKHLRLRRPRDFETVRLEGKRASGKFLALSYRPNSFGHNRYGFVVSKKVGKAVVRNKVKRRLRAAIRARMSNYATGYDVILIARTPAARATYHDLVAALKPLEHSAGLTG